MPHNRYFIDEALDEGAVVLEDSEFHHLINVMRQRAGDEIELVNGRGALALAQIDKIEKHRALCTITSLEQKPSKKPEIILAQALPRLSKLEFILEKGTELGADAFWLFPGLLSEKDTVNPSQLGKLRSWTISALKQCGRLDLPTIELMPPLKDWKAPEGQLFYGDTDPNANPLSTNEKRPMIFFIGPEKGFHPKELEILQSFGAQGVKLSSNILRTETAALAAITLLAIK